jgi:anti-anti-sigma regulatory factor
MMDIQSFQTGDLAAVASVDEQRLLVILKGSADTRVLTHLDDLLGRVHEETVRAPRPEVVVDLRDLDFMNSSCFKLFLTWIMRVQELPEAGQYGIRILSDGDKHWQRRTLGALSSFATNIVRVES